VTPLRIGNARQRAGALAGEDRGHAHRKGRASGVEIVVIKTGRGSTPGGIAGRRLAAKDSSSKSSRDGLAGGGYRFSRFTAQRICRRFWPGGPRPSRGRAANARIHVTRWCCHEATAVVDFRRSPSRTSGKDAGKSEPAAIRRIAQLAAALPACPVSRPSARKRGYTAAKSSTRATYDALVLAARRALPPALGLESRISAAIPVRTCAYQAPGQGIVAVEISRGDDRVIRNAVSPI